MRFEDIEIGQSASLSKKFCLEDVQQFSILSLDTNPIHLDAEFARESIFNNLIVHGFLSSSLISGVIGTVLPGPGAIYIHQDLNFRKPVFHGQVITAEVTVCEKIDDGKLLKVSTVCRNELGDVVVDGYALIKIASIH